MPRTNKPANGSSDSPKPARTSKKGNGRQSLSTILMRSHDARTKSTRAAAATMAPISTIGSRRSASSSPDRATLLVPCRRSRGGGRAPKKPFEHVIDDRNGEHVRFDSPFVVRRLRQQPHDARGGEQLNQHAAGKVEGCAGHPHVAPLKLVRRRDTHQIQQQRRHVRHHHEALERARDRQRRHDGARTTRSRAPACDIADAPERARPAARHRAPARTTPAACRACRPRCSRKSTPPCRREKSASRRCRTICLPSRRAAHL